MQHQERNTRRIFVVLLGVSGVGKSTIIRHLLQLSDDFQYVTPYMTRPLREGETEKISVSEAQFEAMQEMGEFLVVNEHYGFTYGAPKTSVLSTLDAGKIPILDYQLASIDNLENPAYELLKIYIKPATAEVWETRLRQLGRHESSRLNRGKVELEKIANGDTEAIDALVINQEDAVEQTTAEVLRIIQAAMSLH